MGPYQSAHIVEALVTYARMTPISRLWLHTTPGRAGIYQKAGFIDRMELELTW